MANPKVKFKRSSVANKRPTLDNIELGELALNTYDGKLFTRQDTGGVGIATTVTLINPWTESYGGGTISYSGVVTATSFSGDGSNLTGISAGAPVSISTVAPSSPSAGDLWFDPNYGRTVIYYDEATVGYGTSKYWIDPSPVDTDNITITAPSNLTVSGILTATSIDSGTGSFTGDVDIADKIVHTGDTNTAIRFPSNDTVTIETSGSEALRVTSGGDIAINSTSASAKLTVTNNSGTGAVYLADFTASAANQNPLLRMIGRNAADSGTTSVDLYKVYQGGFRIINNDTDSSNFTSFEIGGSERARVSAGGSFGVGTNDPVNLVDVNGSVGVKYDEGLKLYRSTGTINSGIVTHYWSGSKDELHIAPAGNAASEVVLKTSSGSTPVERMRITSSGNFGIGEASPGDKLVVGDTSDSFNAIRLQSTNTGIGEIRFADSDSANPAYLKYEHTGNNLIFAANASERMRIDSSGRLLLGTTSGAGKFIVQDSSLPKIQANYNGTKHLEMGVGGSGSGFTMTTGHFISFNHQPYADRGTDNNLTERFRIHTDGGLLLGNSSSTFNYIANYNQAAKMHLSGAGGGSGNIEIYGASHATLPKTITFNTDSTERMRIASNGYVFYYTTTSFPGSGNTATGAMFENAGDGASFFVSRDNNVPVYFNRNSNGTLVTFRRSGSEVGKIQVTTTATTYATTSDYRLKENVVDLDGAIDRVKQLTPKRFNFIADDTTTVDGFIAHEAQTVVPEAVTGTHNEVDDDDNPIYQGIDQSKLVPLLTAALQEAIAKIETLEAKVAALEAE